MPRVPSFEESNRLSEGLRWLSSIGNVVGVAKAGVIGHRRCHGHHDFSTDSYGGCP